MLLDKWLIAGFCLLCSSYVNAEASEQWQFVITPVLWNASVQARVTDNGSDGEQPVDPDYRFFTLDNLDDCMSLQFEAKHGKLSLMFDSLRARYQDETMNSRVNLGLATELGFVEIAVAYQVLNKQKLDLFIGVRRSFLDIEFNLSPIGSRKRDSDWTDPIIGLRYNYSLNKNWQLWLRGDVGGFGVGTQKTFNAAASAQYIINKYISLSMGYRYLRIDFKEDDFLYDVKLKGVYIGVGIHF